MIQRLATSRSPALSLAMRYQWIPSLLLLLVALMVAAALSLDRRAPMRYIGEPHAKWVGDHVTLTYRIERLRACEATIYRSLIDPRGVIRHLEPMRYAPTQIGELKATSPGSVSMSIPLYQPPAVGEYRLQVAAEYVCNPMHRAVPLTVAFTVPFRYE